MRYNYLLLTLGGLLLIFVFYNHTLKQEIKIKTIQLLQKENKLKNINALKRKWKSSKRKKTIFLATLHKNEIKRQIKRERDKKNSLFVEITELESKPLKKITTSLFESPIIIKSFSIKREDEHHGSFRFGVQF